MDRVCTWQNDIAHRIIHNKKAVSAALFLCFLGYTAAVILSEVKRGTRVSHTTLILLFQVSKNLRRFFHDIAYSQVFFFICAMCVLSLAPGVFATILIYLYMFSLMAQGVAYAIENKVLSNVTFVFQFVLLFILFIVIMADDWCGFFLYRGFT